MACGRSAGSAGRGGSGSAWLCREIARSTAFTRPLALRLPTPSREIDRIVDDRGGGDAGQVKELVGAEAKNLAHFAIEPLDRPLGKMRDQVVEGGSPALDADGDFGGQRLVPIVAKRGARGGERIGKVGASRLHRRQDLVGGDASRRDHGCGVRISPAARG